MNEPRRVVRFVSWSTLLLLLTSVLFTVLGFSWAPFDRVNLISDLFTTDPASNRIDSSEGADSLNNIPSAPRVFERYQLPARIIGFQADTQRHTLSGFLEKLHALQTTRNGKVRIAYFGDSMIEGDLMTQTLRQLLQSYFGGAGVGYVPITSIVSGFRQTVRSEYGGGWTDRNFKQNPQNTPLYLSGHAFIGPSAWARFTDQTVGDSTAILQKHLLYAPDSLAGILFNQQARSLSATGSFGRTLLSTDADRRISLNGTSQTPALFGISFESPDGIVLDNFSFRGITGIELAKLSDAMLRDIAEKQPYDLIVFQYGVNLLFRPMDKDFRWYGRTMQPVIQKFKQAFPTADLLLVSTADRAFRYQGKYSSAVGIDSLVRIQASIAYQSGVAFFNQFATMGGTNSIVDWANRQPPWAGKDYVHPNGRGAAWLGEALYQAIRKEYQLYLQSRKPNQPTSSLP